MAPYRNELGVAWMAYTDRPAMMAIGDSLYQGVRSLSFHAELAPWSPPAQVARALGLPFVPPDPARPVLFDLEAELRDAPLLGVLAAVRRSCLDARVFWQGGVGWSAAGMDSFDNIAVGGATIESLTADSDASVSPKVAALFDRIAASPANAPDFGAISSLWFALNTCFTLNPARDPALAGKTQMDQVEERGPRLLLVNIGSNEGLFRGAFSGALDAATLQGVRDIPGKMEPLIDRLAQLPATVETIAFNSLVRPRTAANLMPAAGTGPDAQRYSEADYYTAYGPRVGSTQQGIPSGDLRAFDALVDETNRSVAALARARIGDRLRWVDLYAASDASDGKHYRARPLRLPGGGVQLRNVPLTVVFGMRTAGGLTGLDNMHPTAPGYALIADAVLDALGSAARTDKDAAFRGDSLLVRPPGSLLEAQAVLALAGSFGVG